MRLPLRCVVVPSCMALLGACALPPAPTAVPAASARRTLETQVRATETAFAKTMADRDHAAFTQYLSAETVFFAGPRALRGKDAVADAWKAFYAGPVAPFSWSPEVVEVLDSGTLALSSGPVHRLRQGLRLHRAVARRATRIAPQPPSRLAWARA